MFKNILKESIKIVAILAIAIPALAFLAGWEGPKGAPPTENASAPVNVGFFNQVKSTDPTCGPAGVPGKDPDKCGNLGVGGFVSRLKTILARDEGNVGIGTANPQEMLHVAKGNALLDGQIQIKGGMPGQGKVLTSDANGLASWEDYSANNNGIGEALVFDVYNSDTTTYECVEQDLKDYCGDEDGCEIRLNLQHETSGVDEVRTISEYIFMEQPSMSNNREGGTNGWTRQEGGGDYGWITNRPVPVRYTIFSPWDWIWALNYRHGNCPDRIGLGNGVRYTNPYLFNFMSHPLVRAKVFVIDNSYSYVHPPYDIYDYTGKMVVTKIDDDESDEFGWADITINGICSRTDVQSADINEYSNSKFQTWFFRDIRRGSICTFPFALNKIYNFTAEWDMRVQASNNPGYNVNGSGDLKFMFKVLK